ncbi:RNA polymerase recycling motor HelD [Cellulosilyticum lentocellum]|uniref:UvrD/REP helicase n=1 Tax=Cellulosilyticum lentocellum (strain ATCC 49066 / DSM 5427 / NCIMB 11756 / RHM5) TaxID=642492 RepID=F2JPT4_CELLD|nr:RNA polymerase recycling motor HelD [Cellulosilyticum lentocellum]ADZ84869.1 UvrD/REP helicase [Cellulosilyticum lentocellum DSM 5427]
MKAEEHKDYKEEAHQLELTKAWITAQSEALKEEGQTLEHEIASLRKEVSSAFDERLVLKLQMRQGLTEDLNKYSQIQAAPYFGRINFKENFTDNLEVVYIGKFGLYDSEKGDMLVLDWRTPMANIYYSGIDEDVAYKAPDGIVEGKMLLKRRYVIEEGKLTEIHDEKSLQDNLKDSLQQGTGFLMDALNKSTSGRLKEIVATIQQEQNQIIRSESFLPLVVQGVAGSGKTTIALHRMAYLIYNQQNPKAKYMVVAPNQLFLKYISDILPDLGVEHVVQTTFEAWALDKLGKGIKLGKQRDKLDTLLVEAEEKAQILALASKLRGSILFAKIIDKKLKRLEASIIAPEGIQYEGITIVSYKELQHMFLVSNGGLPLMTRVKLLGDYIKKKLQDKQADIKELIEQIYARKLKVLKASVTDIETIRQEIIALYDERDEKIKGIKKWSTAYTKAYIKNIALPSASAFYQQMFEEESLYKWLEGKMPEEALKSVIALIQGQLRKQFFETEDLGPLVYIQSQLYGLDDERQYAHIVVDEAQDLDEMKLLVLRKASTNDAFTLVGDLAQGIYGYKGINNWQRVMDRVFEGKSYHYFEMTTSYRSTIEIIELANKVLGANKDHPVLLAQPVFRHGHRPELIRCISEMDRVNQIYNKIKVYEEQGLASICVITKDLAEGEDLYRALRKKGLEIEWLQDEEEQYNGQVAVMPSYLTKGLEFDAVLLYDVSASKFKAKDLDIKLLYVMITRALHELSMYTIGLPTEIVASCL